jgi:hypothetical protein
MDKLAAFIVIFLTLAATGCFTNTGPDPVSAPEVNAAITAAAGDSSAPFAVECDGPDDEVELLRALCGADLTDTWFTYYATDASGYGMGTRITVEGGAAIFFFASAPEDAIDDLSYTAFVALNGDAIGPDRESLELWSASEPVTEGSVTTERATFSSCDGGGWVADATLLWRSTTIRVHFSAGGSGC